MTARLLLWVMRVSFWTVVVVMSFHKDPCPRANDGAHNTIRQMSAPTTLLGSDMPGRSQRTLLAWPDGTFLQVCRVQSSVLRLT